MRMTEEQTNTQVPIIIALSVVLQVSESMIPQFIPGLKLGLPNMLTLLALLTFGWSTALKITICRIVISSIILGTFLSFGFMLSISAGLGSFLVMSTILSIMPMLKTNRAGLIALSILSALTHNLIQVTLAYLLIIKHPGVFLILPYIAMGGVITGSMIGIAVHMVLMRIDAEQTVPAIDVLTLPAFKPVAESRGKNRSIKPELKILSLFAASLLLLIITDFRFYLFMAFLLLTVIFWFRISLRSVFKNLRFMVLLMGYAFFLPLVFHPEGSTIFNGTINFSGAYLGALYASRIFLLLILSRIIMFGSEPLDIIDGLINLITKTRLFRGSEKKAADLLTLSLSMIPVLSEIIKDRIKKVEKPALKDLNHLLNDFSLIISGLFQPGLSMDEKYTPILNKREAP